MHVVKVDGANAVVALRIDWHVEGGTYVAVAGGKRYEVACTVAMLPAHVTVTLPLAEVLAADPCPCGCAARLRARLAAAL